MPQADLSFQVPARGAGGDRRVGGLPGGDAAGEYSQVRQARPGQGLFGLAGTLPGAADQHDLLVEVDAQFVAVLAQHIQGHVGGAGNVGGLELRRGAYVDQPRRVAGGEQVLQGGDVEGAGGAGRRGGHGLRCSCFTCR
jgi:hypothetical protein